MDLMCSSDSQEDDTKRGDSSRTKLFIGGLSQDTTKEKLEDYFGAFGCICDSVVMYDTITSRSRGFGFITFVSSAAAERALEFPCHVIDNKEVECKIATPRDASHSTNRPRRRDSGCDSARSQTRSREGGCDKEKDGWQTGDERTSASNGLRTHPLREDSNVGRSDKVFVGGLPDLTDDEFRGYFEKYGSVVDAVLMFDKRNNRPRGFGFVRFLHPDAVEEVMLDYGNHILHGKWVEVKRAQPRDACRISGATENAEAQRPSRSDGRKRRSECREVPGSEGLENTNGRQSFSRKLRGECFLRTACGDVSDFPWRKTSPGMEEAIEARKQRPGFVKSPYPNAPWNAMPDLSRQSSSDFGQPPVLPSEASEPRSISDVPCQSSVAMDRACASSARLESDLALLGSMLSHSRVARPFPGGPDPATCGIVSCASQTAPQEFATFGGDPSPRFEVGRAQRATPY